MSETPPPAGPPGGQPPQPGQPQPGQPQYGGQPPYGGQPQYGSQPQYGAPPPGPAPYGMPPIQTVPPAQYQGPPQGTNGFAIASLIFGIIGGVLLGAIFGFVALSQIKKRNQGGRGLAIAGLVLSGCWLLLLGVGVVAAILSDDEPDRDASGQVTATTNVEPTKLKVGDCVESVQEDKEVRGMKLVPCSGPNGGEVYAAFELPAGKWPGLPAVQDAVEKECTTRWDALNRKLDESSSIFLLSPVESSWSFDRHASCLVVPTK